MSAYNTAQLFATSGATGGELVAGDISDSTPAGRALLTAANAAAQRALLVWPWLPTTNGLTLTKGNRYVLGAGHTVTLPIDCVIGDEVILAPENGDWATLGAVVDTPPGFVVANTISTQNASVHVVLTSANTFTVII